MNDDESSRARNDSPEAAVRGPGAGASDVPPSYFLTKWGTVLEAQDAPTIS